MRDESGIARLSTGRGARRSQEGPGSSSGSHHTNSETRDGRGAEYGFEEIRCGAAGDGRGGRRGAAARGNARRAAIQVIAAVAQRAFSSTNCEAKVFGSCAYGLDAASSDVDLVITNWCDGELIEDRPYVAYVCC